MTLVERSDPCDCNIFWKPSAPDDHHDDCEDEVHEEETVENSDFDDFDNCSETDDSLDISNLADGSSTFLSMSCYPDGNMHLSPPTSPKRITVQATEDLSKYDKEGNDIYHEEEINIRIVSVPETSPSAMNHGYDAVLIEQEEEDERSNITPVLGATNKVETISITMPLLKTPSPTPQRHAGSPMSVSPRAPSPRAPSPRARPSPSPRAPSPSPRAPSPSPRAPSPSPRAPSPSPRAPSPSPPYPSFPRKAASGSAYPKNLVIYVGNQEFHYNPHIMCRTSDYFKRIMEPISVEDHIRHDDTDSVPCKTPLKWSIDWRDRKVHEWKLFVKFLEPSSKRNVVIDQYTLPIMLPWLCEFHSHLLLRECDVLLANLIHFPPPPSKSRHRKTNQKQQKPPNATESRTIDRYSPICHEMEDVESECEEDDDSNKANSQDLMDLLLYLYISLSTPLYETRDQSVRTLQIYLSQSPQLFCCREQDKGWDLIRRLTVLLRRFPDFRATMWNYVIRYLPSDLNVYSDDVDEMIENKLFPYLLREGFRKRVLARHNYLYRRSGRSHDGRTVLEYDDDDMLSTASSTTMMEEETSTVLSSFWDTASSKLGSSTAQSKKEDSTLESQRRKDQTDWLEYTVQKLKAYKNTSQPSSILRVNPETPEKRTFQC